MTRPPSDKEDEEGPSGPFLLYTEETHTETRMNYEESLMCPGTVGLLIDETPRLSVASIRPLVWGALLNRGATRPSEVVALASVLCSPEDLKVANWEDADEEEDRTWAEVCAEEALGDMLAKGLCRYNHEQDLWVLDVGENDRNVPKVISVVASLDAEMPKHFLLDMSRGHR